MLIHPDLLFPADPGARKIARALFERIRHLPILSVHGHTNAGWFSENKAFSDPAELFIQADHYVFRMLYSQGILLEDLGIGECNRKDPRVVWRSFAQNYFLFRGTPTRLWLDYAFQELFGMEELLSEKNADIYFDTIAAKLETSEFLPRSLYERFHLEVLATTDSPLDSLATHDAIRDSGWKARVLPTFRPDPVVDPDFEDFSENVRRLGQRSGNDTTTWAGYLCALRDERARFRERGCTSTDHGHPTARTANLSQKDAAGLFDRVRSGKGSSEDRELFRAQMLTEMAKMSLDDDLVMQIHPGSARNHNQGLHKRYGRDVGADIPTPTNYVDGLRPLLDCVGNERRLRIILFTLDESTYSRELAPLAGHYPCLWLGPPWWFHDSPEGMMRFREQVTETAGFFNTAGFNDDTRAFLSIPGRHEVARRVDCAFLAKLVAEHRMGEDEAFEIAYDLAYGLAKKVYRL